MAVDEKAATKVSGKFLQYCLVCQKDFSISTTPTKNVLDEIDWMMNVHLK
jgi:hypothetical protein